MADLTNLIYNADFSKGNDGWSSTNASSLSVSNGVLTSSGDLLNDHLIPVANDDIYQLSFDIKFSENDGTHWFYIALRPFDSDKKAVPIANTYRYPTNSNTTLATDVKNGDTTITVADASKWFTGDNPQGYYKKIGICNNLAWGYGRATYLLNYNSISGNTITLTNAWGGGSFAAGTKVANFRAGSMYYYPWHSGPTGLPSEWTHKTFTFSGGDFIRFSTQYIQFSTYGYNHVYSIKNLKLENITSYQINSENSDITAVDFDKNGNVRCSSIGDLGRNIRYIKDSINGSTENAYSHWCEIKALDPQGVNIAYNKNCKIDSGSYNKNYVTDGNTASSPYSQPSDSSTNGHSAIVDLGFVTKITELQIWHYWADGRTYHDNEVSVSEDGTNWDIVYQGEHPETAEGFSIKLEPKNINMYKTGFLETDKIIEY